MEPTQSAQKAAPLDSTQLPRRRWQWSLLTLLLLTAVVGVWAAYWRASSAVLQLREDVTQMQRLAGRLVVDDHSQFAIVEVPEQWHDDETWDVYLPPDSSYLLKLATRDITDAAFPSAAKQVDIAPGIHRIAWESRKVPGEDPRAWAIQVLVDGRAELELEESADWDSGGGGGGTGERSRTEQQDVSTPLVLKRWQFRRRDQGPSPSSTPTNGYMLWIERLVPPAAP